MDVNSRDPLQNIIPFQINGVEIGRFDGSGNLGIGTMTTTATAVRLDISGGAVRVNSGAAANTALTTTGRIGVNTATPTMDLEVNGSAKIGSVVFDTTPLYDFTSHTFTNAGTTGRTGPTLTSVRTAYSGVSWAQNSSYLDMSNNNGIQLWTVPITGSYTIRAVGAAGGNLGTYGKGRDIQTTTTLTKGEVIRILVGQQGGGSNNTRGGGGGTFVVRGTQTPIIVAGGGGGRSETVINEYNNSNASSSTSGNKGGNGEGSNNGAGGTNGGGGVASALTSGGAGGGGLLTDGGNSVVGWGGGGVGGASFINGGVGGLELGYNENYGGFGGGGGSPAGGGGGGGYSGGGGGYDPVWARGGGGGSFTISAMTDYGATNNGHGSVEITLLVVADTKMGVNTATPTEALDVSGNIHCNNILRSNHINCLVDGNLQINTNTKTVSNTAAGAIQLATKNSVRLHVTPDGYVGIGTTTPGAQLHISGAVAGTQPNGYFFAIHPATGWTGWGGGGGTSYSLVTSGNVWFQGVYIWFTSDKRIKKNVREINGNTALSQLRKLRPTIYNNIDSTKGINNVYGFVAQEVKDVILDSTTSNSKDYVPNFYCKGDIYTIDASNHIYEITSENEFRFEKVLDASGNEITNYKIKLYDETNKDYVCVVLHRIDEKTIRVKCEKEYIFSTVEEYKHKVFIYGQEVHDFHNLDKNAIFTVGTAALKELDREQQSDKARIAELEATVATQQSLINDILERLNKNGL